MCKDPVPGPGQALIAGGYNGADVIAGAEIFGQTYWGVFTDVCCGDGHFLRFTVSLKEQNAASEWTGCAGQASWEGYQASDPGPGKSFGYRLQGCGYNSRGVWDLGDIDLEAGVRYLFVLEFRGSGRTDRITRKAVLIP